MTGKLAKLGSIALACGLVLGTGGSGRVRDAAAAPSKSEKAAADVRARELFQKGDTAYAEGRYEEALGAFQEAHELSGRPQLLFNISNAFERLGRLGEAIEALEKYLASGKAKDRDVVQKRLANLRKRVDDQKKAEARAQEEEERRRAEEARKAAAEEPKKESGPPPPPPPPPEKPTPIVPIVVLGAGGLALVAGGVFGVLTLSARSEAEAGCKDGASGRLCSSDAESAVSRDKTFGLVTDIALVSGVVLAGVGAYLLLSSGSKGGKGSVKVGRIEARPTGAGAVVVGTF